ncbi:hypothetical protein A3L09_02060 [Thermococcus profundus]|uniref:Uncharacterized protein n=2 Tax=Thermococcus profundus TaxID=49899 RepID=A0A2Z2M7F4_THEPR|nr:hypothetical protein A3L09_02060 [Thermococcus profundus]
MKKALGVLMIGMLLLPFVSGAVVLKSTGYELHVTPAGNYYAGYATAFWRGFHRPYYGVFMKVSRDGSLEWAYNYSAGRGIILSTTLPLDDGFLLLGEVAGAENAFPLAMKVDESGKPLWVRFYNVSLPDVYSGTFINAIRSESGFLILGLIFRWSGSEIHTAPMLLNMSPSGDVASAEVLDVRDVKEFLSEHGDGWLSMGMNLSDGKLAVVKVSPSGAVESAWSYTLPSSLVGHDGTKLPGALYSYIYPTGSGGVIRALYYLNDRPNEWSFEWMTTVRVQDGKVVSCLNSTNPLPGKHFYPSSRSTLENPGMIYGTFLDNFTFEELSGSNSPAYSRFRVVMINVSLGILEPDEKGGKAYIKPLGDNVTYAILSPRGIAEYTADNRSIVTIFDSENIDPENFGFKEVGMETKPCKVELKAEPLNVSFSSVPVSYGSLDVQYSPLHLEVSLIKEASETAMSPPWLSFLLVLIASLSLALWVRRG